jgi:tryptophanyl-tRNA synthetase
MSNEIALTGIKPSGTPHIGNYLGMIRPALELAQEFQAMYFIADYHALTTVKDADDLKGLTFDVAATWLALGLDP